MDGRDTYDTMTGFQMDLLLAIGALGQPSGLDVKTKLEEWYDNGDVHHGRLYPNLDELVKRGLVHKGSQDRRTNWYSLTEDGIGVADDRRQHIKTVLDGIGPDETEAETGEGADDDTDD